MLKTARAFELHQDREQCAASLLRRSMDGSKAAAQALLDIKANVNAPKALHTTWKSAEKIAKPRSRIARLSSSESPVASLGSVGSVSVGNSLHSSCQDCRVRSIVRL